MTALPKASLWVSPDEYLEGERFSEVRHEYIEGCVYAMAGASDDHNRIAGNIFSELSNQLRGSRCEAFINDMKVKISAASSLFYYPDVLVACDPTDNARYFRERPSVIFEVISPETERVDRREKLLAYREIPSLNAYLVLEQDRVSVTIHRRTGANWQTEYVEGIGASVSLPEINVELSFARIYERTAAGKADSSGLSKASRERG